MSRNSRRRDANAAEPTGTTSVTPFAAVTPPGAVIGAPAPAPVAPVAPATPATDANGVDELRDRIVELQSKVEQLVAHSKATPVSSGDPEIDSASRTLRFAQQTADSVVTEAQQEALAIVNDAERQRSEIIRRAREQADQDYSQERDRVEAASAAWQAQRAEVLEQLDALSEIFAAYQEGLAHLGTTVTSVADRLRSGTIAERIVVDPTAATAELVEPVAATEPVATPADVAAPAAPVDAAEPIAAEPAAAAIDLTDGAESAARAEAPADADRPLTRNPFAPPPVSHLAAVEAGNDPFVFDVTDLPETTGDFAWERESPGESGGDGGSAATF